MTEHQRSYAQIEEESNNVGKGHHEHRRGQSRIYSEALQEDGNQCTQRSGDDKAQYHSHTDDAAEFHAEPHRPKPGAEPNRDYHAYAAANYQTVDQSDQSFFSHNSTRGI